MYRTKTAQAFDPGKRSPRRFRLYKTFLRCVFCLRCSSRRGFTHPHRRILLFIETAPAPNDAHKRNPHRTEPFDSTLSLTLKIPAGVIQNQVLYDTGAVRVLTCNDRTAPYNYQPLKFAPQYCKIPTANTRTAPRASVYSLKAHGFAPGAH